MQDRITDQLASSQIIVETMLTFRTLKVNLVDIASACIEYLGYVGKIHLACNTGLEQR